MGTYRVFDRAGAHLVVGCRIYYSAKKASATQNDLTLQNTAGHAVTSVDRREPVRKFQRRTSLFFYCTPCKLLKGGTSRLVHLEKFSLNFSSSSFVIRVNLLHP